MRLCLWTRVAAVRRGPVPLPVACFGLWGADRRSSSRDPERSPAGRASPGELYEGRGRPPQGWWGSTPEPSGKVTRTGIVRHPADRGWGGSPKRETPDMTAPITDLLTQIEAPGAFATRLRAPANGLEVEVTGVGPLNFPITARTAQKLRGVARPSPFGLREQTLHDPSVRNTWEVAPSRVKITARRWKPVLATYLRRLQTDLGFPDECELEAVFDKLLPYAAGQFFKPNGLESDGWSARSVSLQVGVHGWGRTVGNAARRRSSVALEVKPTISRCSRSTLTATTR